MLADAKQARNLPGRPERDPADSRWLAACSGRGAITSCFAVTPEFRIIRLHTRYRRDLTEERTREKQRAEKLLESAAIKISSVLTGLHGVTGRDIMDHLIAGERNPKVLDWLARAAARRKISQLEEAVEGAEFFTPAHAALLAKVLARTGRLTAGIDDLSQVIEQLLAPYEEQLQQAESMPGWQRRAAQDAVAGTGVGAYAASSPGAMSCSRKTARSLSSSAFTRPNSWASGMRPAAASVHSFSWPARAASSCVSWSRSAAETSKSCLSIAASFSRRTRAISWSRSSRSGRRPTQRSIAASRAVQRVDPR